MLATAGDYISEARRVLQDEVVPYRYPDADLLGALNLAIREARRIRPGLFLGAALPTASSAATAIAVDPMYRSALLYYVIGWTEMRDSEDTKDARAAMLLNKFTAQLQSIQA